MRRIIIAAFAALTFTMGALAAPAAATAAGHTKCTDRDLLETYSARWHAVKDKHGNGPQGRNIRRWGMRGGKRSTCRPIARSSRQLHRLLHPPAPQLTAVGAPSQAPSGVASPRVGTGTHLAAIAACESGGDPGAISPDGTYRGKYQFDRSTWASVGGTGDPAAAPEAEQDQRAAALYARSGAAPWPVCGR